MYQSVLAITISATTCVLKSIVMNLQRGKNKKYCKMNLDDHVGELIRKHLSHQTEEIPFQLETLRQF